MVTELNATKEGDIFYEDKKLTPFRRGKGYLGVSFKGKRYYIHRLVAQQHIPNPENKPQVNHLDENKHNNCVENLEWCSPKENAQHSVLTGTFGKSQVKRRQFTDEEDEEICEHRKKGLSLRKIGILYKVTHKTISDIVNKITYKKTSKEYGL